MTIMYDGMTKPERNDACWCQSGKKYKKCHLEFDERLQALHNQGEDVPPHSLLKTAADIEGVKRSALVNIELLDHVASRIAPGVTTAEIDQWVYDYTVSHGAVPAPLNYEGFPCSVCTSANEVVCHGIPSADEVLKDGDIINVDCSTILDGYFSDSSRMFMIGDVSPEAAELVRVVKESLDIGLAAVKPWGHLGDIGAAINAFAREHGYTVVREFGGHGIGLEFHEDPFVGFTAQPNSGCILVPGLMFTIEPMVNLGKQEIDMTDPNGWTVRTADGSLTAQWEVQIVITDDGYETLCW